MYYLKLIYCFVKKEIKIELYAKKQKIYIFRVTSIYLIIKILQTMKIFTYMHICILKLQTFFNY